MHTYTCKQYFECFKIAYTEQVGSKPSSIFFTQIFHFVAHNRFQLQDSGTEPLLYFSTCIQAHCPLIFS